MASCIIDWCRNRAESGLCPVHLQRFEHYADTLADKRTSIGLLFSQRSHVGPFFCICPVARLGPDNKTCACGYPCVHAMAPRVRDRALAKMSRLADQIVEPHSERSHG